MERDAFPDLLKRGISQLTRLRHPRILTIERSLEESRDNFAFCTEPVSHFIHIKYLHIHLRCLQVLQMHLVTGKMSMKDQKKT